MVAAVHALKALPRVIRAPEWWAPKIAPLLGVAYIQVSLQSVAPAKAYGAVAALLAGLACLSAFGFVISDVFDLAPDRALGKPNVLAPLRPPVRALLVVSLGLGGVLPWLLVPLAPPAWWAWAGIYALLAAYSAPGLRLKQRGLAGVLADAAMAHVLPTMFVCLLFAARGGADPPQTVLAFLVLVWATCLGVRNALIGQLWDYANDVRTGTTSFTVTVGPQRATALARRVAFPGEILALAALSVAAAPALPWLPWVVALELVHELRRPRGWGRRCDPVPPGGGTVALHDLYQVWLPVSASVALAFEDWRFALLPLVHVVLFRNDIRRRAPEPLPAAARLLTGRKARADRRPHGLPSPSTCYLICATPRSGSYYLCETLWRTRLLGRPSEYFLPWFVIDRNLRDWDPAYIDAWRLPASTFLQRVVDEGSTPNGVFGVKVMGNYFDVVLDRLRGFPFLSRLPGAQVLPELWPTLRYIVINRRDKVRQAVSMAKAVQSRTWVDLDLTVQSTVARDLKRGLGGVGALRGELAPSSPPPRYDFDQILAFYRERQEQEAAWATYFRAAGVEPFTIHYEDLVAGDRQTAIAVAAWLGVDGVPGVAFPRSVLRPQSDAVNDEWSLRFREELTRRG